MKKSVIVVCLFFLFTSLLPAMAEDDFNTNRDYYNTTCAKDSTQLSVEEQQKCRAFMQYMSDQSASLRKELEDIENKRKDISENIQEAVEKIADYNSQIGILAKEISQINTDILVKEAEISAKEMEIAAKQAEIDALKQKIKGRMVTSQPTMRLNQYLDIIMGARDLTDLIRRSNGIRDITKYDEKVREDLLHLIDQLNEIKAQLEEEQKKLEEYKATVVEKQNVVIKMKREAQIVKEEYLKKEAELEAQGNRIAGDLEAIKSSLKLLSNKIGNIPNSSGFVVPVQIGRISAGTWYYPNGWGVHLGMDFAAPIGTSVKAVGNGIVIKSVDGCGDNGSIGNWCGSAQGGSGGGGNQVYLLTRINNRLYAIKYLHLQAGSPIAQGTIVNAGDIVARVGNSGNSSGPHCHVEVFNLGTQSINDFVSSWNGDLAFGAGWGAAALNNTCAAKGAPCRERPENVFGY